MLWNNAQKNVQWYQWICVCTMRKYMGNIANNRKERIKTKKGTKKGVTIKEKGLPTSRGIYTCSLPLAKSSMYDLLRDDDVFVFHACVIHSTNIFRLLGYVHHHHRHEFAPTIFSVTDVEKCLILFVFVGYYVIWLALLFQPTTIPIVHHECMCALSSSTYFWFS